jgi:hypothetical protein
MGPDRGLVCEELLSDIQKAKTVLHPNLLYNLLLEEGGALPVAQCLCSGAVHTVEWVRTWLFTVPTLTALTAKPLLTALRERKSQLGIAW